MSDDLERLRWQALVARANALRIERAMSWVNVADAVGCSTMLGFCVRRGNPSLRMMQGLVRFIRNESPQRRAERLHGEAVAAAVEGLGDQSKTVSPHAPVVDVGDTP